MKLFVVVLSVFSLLSGARLSSIGYPLEREAATSDVEDNDEIVGGTSASICNFQSLGFLTVNNQFYCAGTLYKSKYVITAAHCLFGQTASSIAMNFNSTSLQGSPGIIKVQAKNIKIHPNYNDNNAHNDIGVIALTKAVPLPSVTLGTAAVGASATIVGWGRTSIDAPQSPTLLKATVKIVDNAVCARKYNSGRFNPIISTQVCASAAGNTCRGDSGGPVFVGSTQVGITSFGDCGINSPSVYTRTSDFKSWVDTVISTL